MPAVLTIAGVIIFPWLFTLFMSFADWSVTGKISFVGLENYATLFADERFRGAVVTTLLFTSAAVFFPIVLGTLAALVFNEKFAGRGLFRALFIMPMMATPVAVALVWTMMFHPQLGVLNYLLMKMHLPTSLWVYDIHTVIPTLVMIEVWHWTPLVMLIVLGGLAGLPREPYESALIDGAGTWAMFRHITLPLLWPFITIAMIIRTIDALKAFDTIFVITQGGPGTASETINLFLYQQAFGNFKMGYASAVVVIFFGLIVALALVLLHVRQKSRWNA